MRREHDRATDAIASLGDPVRRRMYQFVRSQPRPVSREEVAGGVGTSRKLAAFHLEKLVERGLLTVRVGAAKRPQGGRPAKLYEVSDVEVAISLPERRYDLLGEILVAAVDGGGPEARARATAAARRRGVEAGEQYRHARPPSQRDPLAVARGALDDLGFEPIEGADGAVWLRNCAFRALARRAPELVCGLNQAFVVGLLEGIGARRVEATAEPGEGRCCVVLRRLRDA